ncbi:MAG: PAS domain S-box protein, partial [Calditrichota bacterium]
MRNPISRFIESERFHPLTAVWTGVIISLAFFATVGFILLRTYYGMFQDETEIAQLQMLVNRIEQMNERRQEAFERLIIKGDSVELTNCLNEADDFWEHVDSVVAITEQDSLPLVISDIRNTREDLLTLEKQAKTQYASGNTLTALHSLNSHEYTYLNRALTQEIKQAEDLLTAQQWQSLASFRHRLILIAALGTLFTLLLAAAWLAVISGMKHYLDRSQSAELAQQESETKYRNLIESVPHAVLIFQKGCIAFANRGTAEMLGYSDPQQLIGTPLDKLIAPEDVERVLDYHRARIEHRSAPEHYTGTFLRNNGEGFTAEVFVRGVLYQGAPAFQALVMDVTERKLAEQSLRESEERFRSLADSAPVLIWMAGVDRHTYYFNKTWQRFTGRSVAKEYGRGWTEGVHANDLLRVLSTYKNAFEARRPFSIEFRLMHADGTYHWLLDTGAPRFTADGSFTGFIGSCVDITDRKRTDHEILKLSQAIEGLPESVVLTDVTGIIEYVNPAVIRLGGWNKASDVIGTSIFEYSDAAGRQRLQTAILPELMRAGSWHGDIEITLKNGNTIPSEVTAAIIPDETGQPAHLVASFRDISERKKAEAELQRERSQLLTLFDSIDEVIYVSDPQTHEILYINEACRKLIGDAVSKRCYSAIHNSAEPCAFCTN